MAPPYDGRQHAPMRIGNTHRRFSSLARVARLPIVALSCLLALAGDFSTSAPVLAGAEVSFCRIPCTTQR